MRNLKNRVFLIGRVGNDVELKETSTERSYLRVRLAVNEFYFDKEGQKTEKTEWFNLISWGVTAERMAKVIGKGDKIMIEARLSNNNWQDKEGNNHYDLNIVVDDFMLLKSKRARAEQKEQLQESG